MSEVVFESETLDAIKLLLRSANSEASYFDLKDIELFLWDSKKLEVHSMMLEMASIKSFTESKVILNSLKNAKKCLLIITAGLDLTLEMIDKIMKIVQDNTSAKKINFMSNCVDSMKGILRVDLYLVK